MKLVLTLIFALLVATVFISGCVQQATTGGGQQLTAAEKEQQAYSAVEQEMEQTLDNMTLDEIENELLQQG